MEKIRAKHAGGSSGGEGRAMGDWRLGAKSFMLCAIFGTLLTIYLSIQRITGNVELALFSQVMTIKFLLVAVVYACSHFLRFNGHRRSTAKGRAAIKHQMQFS
jgi:hypothetical protein